MGPKGKSIAHIPLRIAFALGTQQPEIYMANVKILHYIPLTRIRGSHWGGSKF